MPKPLIAKTSYPSVKDITRDLISARIISPAYATSCGELNTVLQYIYQSFCFNHAGKESMAELIQSIAIAEMMHLNFLGNALINMGVQPLYTFIPPTAFNFYSTKFVPYSSNLANMLDDDIVAEKHAIESYKKMLRRLKNEKVSALIERILQDEQIHLDAFVKAREEFC